MGRPTPHQMRLATLQWCFRHTRVAGNAAIKRAVRALTADRIAPSETLRMLLGIFEQVDFEIDQDELIETDTSYEMEIMTEDDQCQAWTDVANRWDEKWHIELVTAIYAAGLGSVDAAGEIPDGYEGQPIFRQMEVLREVEGRQADLGEVLDQVEELQVRESEGYGAW
jgi:hypothetical protein